MIVWRAFYEQTSSHCHILMVHLLNFVLECACVRVCVRACVSSHLEVVLIEL